MDIDTTTPWTRRALLAGVGGALTGLVAQALGRPITAQATPPPVVLGTYNVESTFTQITNTSGGDAFKGYTDSGAAVHGETSSGIGVDGKADSGTAIRGLSYSGSGVHAGSTTGYGLEVTGRTKLYTAGGVTIPSGLTSARLTLYVDVTDSSLVLLTPTTDIGHRRLWYTRNLNSKIITVHMSPARSTPTNITWLLLG